LPKHGVDRSAADLCRAVAKAAKMSIRRRADPVDWEGDRRLWFQMRGARVGRRLGPPRAQLCGCGILPQFGGCQPVATLVAA